MVRRNTAQTDTPQADASRAGSPEPQEEVADDAVRLVSIQCDHYMSSYHLGSFFRQCRRVATACMRLKTRLLQGRH